MATPTQVLLLSRGSHTQPAAPTPRLSVRTTWPGFATTRQPPVPRPETRTTSPTATEAGRVIATCASLLARYPTLAAACCTESVTCCHEKVPTTFDSPEPSPLSA